MSSRYPGSAYWTRLARLNAAGSLEDPKFLLMAYDQGLEHSWDFDPRGEVPNWDPRFIFSVAKETGIPLITHKGHFLRHGWEFPGVPMVIKLNGKTQMASDNRPPHSAVMCSVEDALRFCPDLCGVGFTAYVGSDDETGILEELGVFEEEARESQVPPIGWFYPRGTGVEGTAFENIRYATRVASEVGMAMAKVYYPGDDNLKELSKAAGGMPVVIAGGVKEKDPAKFLHRVELILEHLQGLAVGRNIWQDPKPVNMVRALQVLFRGEGDAEDAVKVYEGPEVPVPGF
ncbi:MAG: class I fructose-bisphosphate aldolase [Promethearchaeota archaeon]